MAYTHTYLRNTYREEQQQLLCLFLQAHLVPALSHDVYLTSF
ncbi:hypothetical protein [Candidatus Berkiella cookevillensis]|uniref:Uncharacterized protein n=1 Tax=Candidatus Berkiella cookevillensis TaxID=437022 RepID=A0A0Q9YMZ6_9GAMM|nr:hypothetical protein [Candidatus Berkiella cookevillensis]